MTSIERGKAENKSALPTTTAQSPDWLDACTCHSDGERNCGCSRSSFTIIQLSFYLLCGAHSKIYDQSACKVLTQHHRRLKDKRISNRPSIRYLLHIDQCMCDYTTEGYEITLLMGETLYTLHHSTWISFNPFLFMTISAVNIPIPFGKSIQLDWISL